MNIVKDSTDVSVLLYIADSTDGTPELGVAFNTAGIDLKYRRDGAVATSITEATLAALTTAHTDGGFLEIGNGWYRFDVPDAAFATGVDKVLVYGTVTGMIVYGVTVELTEATVDANVTQISGDSTAASNLSLSAGQIIPGTVDTGTFTPTTSSFEADDITEATADHYNGRVIIFTSGDLLGQATSITDYSLQGSNGRFTVVAMTEAPANDVTFIII